jgi:putative transposase
LGSLSDELDGDGRRLVVRNGRGKERRVTVGSGTLAMRAPRVNDKRVDAETGERRRFSSRILPRYARRSPCVTDVLPVLYLRGLSSGDFAPALRDLLGEDASGLSASSISRLAERWREEHRAFKRRRLDFVRYAYLFADGVHVSGAPGRGQAPVPAGDHRCPRGRPQGAAGRRGRLPRVDRLVGGAAA